MYYKSITYSTPVLKNLASPSFLSLWYNWAFGCHLSLIGHWSQNSQMSTPANSPWTGDKHLTVVEDLMTRHIPLHDNKQTFAIVVSVLIDVDDLHNVITHRRSIVKVHFTTCLWHILQSLHTELAQVRSNHMHENMAKDRSIIILKWSVQIFIYLKIMLRITLAITITSREVLTYKIIRRSL